MDTSRRSFLLSGGAFALAAGCRSTAIFGKPDLVFGVVSDIHITTPESCELFERSLKYFKRRSVDAVMAPGDLTDWGLRSSIVYLKQTWDKVFAGTDVVPLFATGNHDYDGWWYGDMTMEMHANGYSEDEALSKLGLDKQWKEVMGEDFAAIRKRTVKGYDFISGEWQGYDTLGKWMDENGGQLSKTKPFFYFQHVPIKGTTADSYGWSDNGKIKPILSKYPNCVAFTGHKHRPFIDERSIWQGEFTAISTPSLSYSTTLEGYENGGGLRNGKAVQTMPVVPYRRDLRGGQGYVVNVWSDKIVIERIDLEEEASDAPQWVVPLPLGKTQPFLPQVREKSVPVPYFPAGATCRLRTVNTDNRVGKWTIAMECVFPSAITAAGHRVFDYEIKAVPKNGSKELVKRFLSPAFAKMAKYEPEKQRFWFDVAELPQDCEYVIEIRARNSFGKSSAPIVSRVLRGKPGLGKANRT